MTAKKKPRRKSRGRSSKQSSTASRQFSAKQNLNNTNQSANTQKNQQNPSKSKADTADKILRAAAIAGVAIPSAQFGYQVLHDAGVISFNQQASPSSQQDSQHMFPSEIATLEKIQALKQALLDARITKASPTPQLFNQGTDIREAQMQETMRDGYTNVMEFWKGTNKNEIQEIWNQVAEESDWDRVKTSNQFRLKFLKEAKSINELIWEFLEEAKSSNQSESELLVKALLVVGEIQRDTIGQWRIAFHPPQGKEFSVPLVSGSPITLVLGDQYKDGHFIETEDKSCFFVDNDGNYTEIVEGMEAW